MSENANGSDVSAVVLTIGEESVNEAMESLGRQTLRPKEIIQIKNVVPFYQALNQGASMVKTDFFVQVDADMVLNDYAIETLRQYMKTNVAVSVGTLEDPLFGKICGLKMFRTDIFKKFKFINTISPDTDYFNQIEKSGWRTVFIAQGLARFFLHGKVLGKHNRNYDPLYLYQKLRLNGIRIRYRLDFIDFINKWGILRKDLPAVRNIMALIGLSHGIFGDYSEDMLQPFQEDADFSSAYMFITKNGARHNSPKNMGGSFRQPACIFKYHLLMGMELGRNNLNSAFIAQLNCLVKKSPLFSSIAVAGLCQGLFCKSDDEINMHCRIFNDLVGSTWYEFVMKRASELFIRLKRYLTHFS